MQGAGASQRRSCRARVQAQAALLGAQQLGFVRIWRGKVSSRPGSPLQWAVARRLTRNPNDRASPTGARACKRCAIEPRARSGRGRHGAPNSFILRTGWRQHASSLGKPGDGARPRCLAVADSQAAAARRYDREHHPTSRNASLSTPLRPLRSSSVCCWRVRPSPPTCRPSRRVPTHRSKQL